MKVRAWGLVPAYIDVDLDDRKVIQQVVCPYGIDWTTDEMSIIQPNPDDEWVREVPSEEEARRAEQIIRERFMNWRIQL